MRVISDDGRFIVQIEPRNMEADPPILRIVQIKPPAKSDIIAALEPEELVDLLRFNGEVAKILRQKGFIVRLGR